MLIRKIKPLNEGEIQEINSTIDIIDISLYDLIKKRTELMAELNAKTDLSISDLSKSLSLSIEKITSQRKYDKQTLSTTSGLIELINLTSRNIELGLVLKDELSSTSSYINNLFPLFDNIKYKYFSKYSEIISNITHSNNLMAVIPATKTSPKDVWWMGMLAPEKQNVKIINKIPLIEDYDKTPEYLIANSSNYWNFDRSIMVIATSETITNTWLKSALHRLQIPL